jgi:hypothetical protein
VSDENDVTRLTAIPSLVELGDMTDDDLRRRYDAIVAAGPLAGPYVTGDFFLRELDRRHARRRVNQMLALTVVILVLTGVNVVAVFVC